MIVLVGLCGLLSGCSGGGGGDSGSLGNPTANAAVGLKGLITGVENPAGVTITLVPSQSTLPVFPPQAAIRAQQGPSLTTRTDSTGAFTLPDVAPGTYNLIARDDNGSAALVQNINIVAGITTVSVTLTPTGTISGEIVVPTGFQKAGLVAYVAGTSFVSFTDDNGRFTLTGVPIGNWAVTFYYPGIIRQTGNSVAVSAGANTTLSVVTVQRDEAFFTQTPTVTLITWKGALSAAPANPELNWAYYHTGDRKTYLWDGTQWTLLSQDAVDPGAPTGTAVIWKGNLTSPPANPVTNWAYYHETDRRTYLWDGDSWEIMSQGGTSGLPGTPGSAGTTIFWQGSLAAPPATPQVNWAYFHTVDRKTYLFDGTNWQMLAQNSGGDVTPPVIASVNQFQENATDMTFTFSTNEDAVVCVEYGLSPTFGSVTPFSTTYHQTHYLTIPFSTSGPFHYRIRAKDAFGNESVSTASQFAFAGLQMLWNKAYGGAGIEHMFGMAPTTDGGAILVGETTSAETGDVSGFRGGVSDVWVIRVNSSGSLLWQKCLGGSSQEHGQAICRLSDGNFMIAGATNSSGGDVSVNPFGGSDFWMIKIDPNGNVLWDTCLGSSGEDEPLGITATTDGGCIVVGQIEGGDGTLISTPPINGYSTYGSDMWVVKLNSDGSIAWNTCLGDSGQESATSVCQTPDGGYLIGGWSNSASFLGESLYGSADAIVVKLTAVGAVSWVKPLGGSGYEEVTSVINTADGGFMVGALTESEDGDVSGNHAVGTGDAWLVKLTNAGSIQWQKCYGGTGNESKTKVIEFPGGGYLFGANTQSEDGDLKRYYSSDGDNDMWVGKTDASGNLLWEKTIGGSSNEMCEGVFAASDGTVTIGGWSDSTDVDFSPGYGSQEFRLIRFKPQ